MLTRRPGSRDGFYSYHNATQSECAPRLLVSTGALMCIGVPVSLVPFVFMCPPLYLDEHLYTDAHVNMDCYFILRNP